MTDNSLWAKSPERFALAKVYHDVAEVIGWDRAIEFGMAVWERKRPPSRAKTDPIHGGGVGVIYIPAAINDFVGRELVQLVGPVDAARLVDAFAGNYLEFPCIVAASIGRRNKAIAQQVADGARVAVVACAFDLTGRQVRRIAANAGVKRHASRSSAAKAFAAPCGRRDEMAALAAIGKPRKEIAALYGVTNQAVALAINSRNRNFQTGITTE